MYDIELPEDFDPYDMRLKRYFNAQADKKNVLLIVRGKPRLCCGAITGTKKCKNSAGSGTDHLGYGRCRIHGGCNTGPKTEEGKNKTKYNGLKHGLYMRTLLPGEEAIFDAVTDEELKGLDYEINILKTKIIAYLTRQSDKFIADVAKYGEEEAYKKSRVWFKDGENGRSYYHAGTIEDNALDRALRTLRSLVETQNRIKGVDEDSNILDVINTELKAASRGKVLLSWSASGNGDKPPENT